jgi:hypothetical protein
MPALLLVGADIPTRCDDDLRLRHAGQQHQGCDDARHFACLQAGRVELVAWVPKVREQHCALSAAAAAQERSNGLERYP